MDIHVFGVFLHEEWVRMLGGEGQGQKRLQL